MQSHTGSRIRIGALAAITFIALGSAWLIARAEEPRGSGRQPKQFSPEAVELKLAKLTHDTMGNVTFCAQHYLTSGGNNATANYQMCGEAATELFESEARKIGITNEVTLSDSKHLIAVWMQIEAQVTPTIGQGGVATVNQQAGFQNCVTDYDANVTF